MAKTTYYISASIDGFVATDDEEFSERAMGSAWQLPKAR